MQSGPSNVVWCGSLTRFVFDPNYRESSPTRSQPLPHLSNPPSAHCPSAGGAPPWPSRLPLAVLAAVAQPCYCHGRAAPLQLRKEARLNDRTAAAIVAFPGRIDDITACSPPSGTAPGHHCSRMRGYGPSPPSIRLSTGACYPGLSPALPLAASAAASCLKLALPSPFPYSVVREKRGKEEK
ncbi:hypothetical protein PVAP13_5NG617101 [Panicum virgatum]|uniref:Uncharacterized protein n=1 Tax=Panicum virgatum TaxID=38727 RepID=A0A8T0S953_PANVG|nr:hypothetical protein PVAP13_5NG617101 [Panicum virgatum]